MRRELTKSDKVWLAIFITSILFIIGGVYINSGAGKEPGQSADSENIYSLHDKFIVGDLTFELYSAELLEWRKQIWGYDEKLGERVVMDVWPTGDQDFYWSFNVLNEGSSFVNVSNCGTLLFEDRSQYFSSNDVVSNSEGCDYKIIAPGARIQIVTRFHFEDSGYLHRSWDSVEGNKIIYLGQHGGEVIKFEIDKTEIDYTNHTFIQ